MRKSLLAIAALMGASVLPAKAAMFRVNEETYANFGYGFQAWMQNVGKQIDNDKARTDFSVNNAKVYFSGQVNPMVKFHVELDTALGRYRDWDEFEGRTKISDAHASFVVSPELTILVGHQRLPFSRQTLTSSYSTLTPGGHGYGRVAGWAPVFESVSMGAAGFGGSSHRDTGISIMSTLEKGMVVIRAGIFDGGFDNRSTGIADESPAIAFRVQFTPTMYGYKGETGYSLSDTYLGRQNVFTVGVGYNTQKNKVGNHTWKMLTFDVNWEEKKGDLVPNLQFGFNDLKDYNPAKDDARAFWLQGQLLYNYKMGVGRPAVAFGWYASENKPANGGPKEKVNRYALYFNYYMKGQAAKIQAGLDTFQRNKADKDAQGNGKNYTDFTFAFQTLF